MSYIKHTIVTVSSLVIFLFATIQPGFSQDEDGILSLNGTWQMHQQGSQKIYNSEVPGVVHLDLIDNKVIADPFYATWEEKVQWVSDTGWVYEKYFELDRTFFRNRNIQLVCEGLDTYANVYLNDSLIITADNMFKTWYANIKQILYVGYNKIRIEFPSINRMNRMVYDEQRTKLPGGERMATRKAAYQYGWDFAPKLLSMGIWKPIYIKTWDRINVLGVNYIQKSLTDSVAKLTASVVLMSDLADTAEFRLLYDSTVFFSGKQLITKGVNAFRIDFDMIEPVRWWPNGMGAAAMYDIGYEIIFSGKLEAKGSEKIGLRTIELIEEPDEEGTSFYLKINDVPTYIRGANYVPMDMFPSRVTDSNYRDLLSLVDQANINMLRVWGGGIYEDEAFYDICDEKGIMVWQDFMFANGMPSESKEYFKNIRSEIVQQVVRLRHHPSIVLWCGNNEIEEGWKNWGWIEEFGFDKKDSGRIYRNYKQIFDQVIPWALMRFDTLRPYIPTSPKHGWGNEISLKEGDSHYWGVWWGDEPFSVYEEKVGRFMSEFGFQGFPDYSTIEKFTRTADRNLGSAVLKAHQKHPTGFEKIDSYMMDHYKVPANLEDYAYVSQLLQADGIKTAIDAHRRAKPYNMGTMFWQLNDPWPGITWSAIDYYGTPKALYYTMARSYDDFFVSPVLKNGRLKVYATFDEPDNQKAHLRTVVARLDGSVVWEEKIIYNFSASETEVVIDTNLSSYLKNEDPANLFVYSRIENILGIRATNIAYLVPPKDLKLEKKDVDITIEPYPEGYLLRIYCPTLVKGLKLSTDVPGSFSDNYFDLLPYEEKLIKFKTDYHPVDIDERIKFRSLIDTYPKE
jgi:beta-mannosidase